MKYVFFFLSILLSNALKAQNWQPFATAPANYNHVVNDSVLPNSCIMPLVNGVNALSAPILNPQYGLRVRDYQLLGNTQRWRMKPNNNLLYLGCFDNEHNGRYLLKLVELSSDTITLSGDSTTLKFSLLAQADTAYFAANLADNQVFLKRSPAYAVSLGSGTDSLINYTALVYNQSMDEQINHHLHNQHIITISQNRGLIHFPDMAFLELRLVSCNRVEFQEPLLEDYLNFDVGDKFVFRINDQSLIQSSYLTFNEIISKTEEVNRFVYVEKITGLNGPYSTYDTIKVPKNTPLRPYLITYYPLYGNPYPQTALSMDSIAYSFDSGVGMEEFTYFKAPIEMQGRSCLTNPYGNKILKTPDGCDFTRMVVEGVGFLNSYCLMIYNGGPFYQAIYTRKVLLAYEKVNGDSYQMDINWDINENQTSKISIFPNPAYDNVTLKSELTGLLMNEICLMDVFGNPIRQENYPSTETIHFSLDDLPAGIYFLRVGLSSGTYYTQKIIKGQR